MASNQAVSPSELRGLIRESKWTTPTTGLVPGFVQANLVMLPKEQAFHFLLFCVRNPKPCPILDVLEPGQVEPSIGRVRTFEPICRNTGSTRKGCSRKRSRRWGTFFMRAW